MTPQPPVAIRCPSGKRRYLDRHTADRALREMRAKCPGTTIADSYLCKCGTWHLTSQPGDWHAGQQALDQLFQSTTT